VIWTLLLERQYSTAGDSDCEIYRAVYDSVVSESGYGPFVVPITVGETNGDETLVADDETGPTKFYKYFDEESKENEFPRHEVSEIDTSNSYFGAFDTAQKNIRPCFKGRNVNHLFFNAPLIMPAATKTWFSNIGYSEDRRYAILYSELHCSGGGFCGHGYYILFEKIDQKWEEVGIHMIWIS